MTKNPLKGVSDADFEHVHDLGTTLRKKGISFDEQCKIFEVCNPGQAAIYVKRGLDPLFANQVAEQLTALGLLPSSNRPAFSAKIKIDGSVRLRCDGSLLA